MLDPVPPFRNYFYFKCWLDLGILWFRLSINSLLNPQRAGTQTFSMVCLPSLPLYSHRTSRGLHSAPSISFLLSANKDRHFHFVSAEALNSFRSRLSQELEQLES